MALDGTYAGLQASIAGLLHRTDMASQIVDCIVLAEAPIARDLRIRSQVTSATLSTVAGTQAVAMPTGWLEFENVGLGLPATNLVYVNIEYLDTKYPENYFAGKPAVYSIEGANLLLGPTPDDVYPITALYYKKYDPLSVTPTNYLLANHPSIYLFAALAEASVYTMDDKRVALYEAKYQKELKDVQDKDDQGQFSGSVLRVRTL